MISDSGLLF